MLRGGRPSTLGRRRGLETLHRGLASPPRPPPTSALFGWRIQPDSASHNSIFLSRKISPATSQPASQQYFPLTRNQPAIQPASQPNKASDSKKFPTLRSDSNCSNSIQILHHVRFTGTRITDRFASFLSRERGQKKIERLHPSQAFHRAPNVRICTSTAAAPPCGSCRPRRRLPS